MKSIRTASILAAAVITVGTLSAAPSVASESVGDAPSAQQAQTSTDTDLDSKTIAKADKFVKTEDGKLTFEKSKATTLDGSEKKQVQDAVDEWNRNSDSGSLETQSGAKTIDAQEAKVVSGEHGYIEAHWWGLKIHVDSYLKGKIQSGAATGSAIAAGIGLASSETGVGGVAGGVVSAALAGAAGIIGVCSEEDGGVTFYEPITGGAPVCNPLA